MEGAMLSAPEPPSATDDTQLKTLARYRVALISVAVISLIVGGVIGAYVLNPRSSVPPLTPPPAWITPPSERASGSDLPTAELAAQEIALATATPFLIQVYVSGAVKHPQVVALPAESLVNDALAAAGGPSADANLDAINLAAPLQDHMHVLVPSKSQVGTPYVVLMTSTPEGLLNINTATAEQLTSLPSIGETRAQDIVTYRESHGPFLSIEDIQQVPGIGAATFENIAPYITVGP
jgi:competence protein ComEA